MKTVIKTFLCQLVVAWAAYTAGPCSAGLVVTCDSAGGYCKGGGRLTIESTGGDNVIIPRPPSGDTHWRQPKLRIVYLLKQHGYSSPSLKPDLPVSNEELQGATTWSHFTPAVTGVYILPGDLPIGGDGQYCIAVWIETFGWDGNNGYPVIAYGSDKWVEDVNLTCAADAPPPPPPTTCFHDAGSDLTVDFGTVAPGEVPSTGRGPSSVQYLPISCNDDVAHTVHVSLKMAPTTWDLRQIALNNHALGVRMEHQGQPIGNGEEFSVTINKHGVAEITFYLLKDPGVPPAGVGLGDATGSAVLVLSTD